MRSADKTVSGVSTHSHPKVAASSIVVFCISAKFQHTATRRWLLNQGDLDIVGMWVSTHSHPKVAAGITFGFCSSISGFNTQPPEGGCKIIGFAKGVKDVFQHTATRRWLLVSSDVADLAQRGFNTQPPEGGCISTCHRFISG